MTQNAFLVALPVTDPGGSNDISGILPARFQYTVAGEWHVVFSEAEPRMAPSGKGFISMVVAGKFKQFPRTKDTRSVLLLRPVAVHMGSSRAVFVAVSEDLGFLKWAKTKAENAGFQTWTKAELAADNSADAVWLRNNADPEDLAAVRVLLAGMDSSSMDSTDASDIANATALPE